MDQQERTVKQIKYGIKDSFSQIDEKHQEYQNASTPAAKIQYARQVQALVNKADQDLKNYEFEVNMLPMSSRETFREGITKLRNQYNQCRRKFFMMEDDLGINVLHQVDTDLNREYGDDESGQRNRNLNNMDEMFNQQQTIGQLNQKAENTAFLLREANANLYKDRKIIRKVVDDEYKIRGAIEQAHYKVIEIERMAFVRKCVMYAITKKQKVKNRIVVLIIFLITCINQSSAFITGNVITSPQTINSESTYTFEVTLQTNIPSGGVLQITFPTGIDLSLSPSLSCTPIYGLTGSTATCTKQSSTILKVTGVFPNTDTFIIIQLSKFVNPGYVSTFNPVLAQYDSTTSTSATDASGSSTFKFSTLPGSLSLTVSSTSSLVVGEKCNVDMTLQVSNTLQSTGRLEVVFPKWNAETPNNNLVESMIAYDINQFSSSDSGYLVTCSSTGHPSLKCVIVVQTSFTKASSAYDTFKVSGFSSNIVSTNSLVIKLTGSEFLNPPSTKPISSISAATYNSNGQQLDSKSTGITYQALTGATISSSGKIQIIPLNKNINQQTQYDFIVELPLPLPVGSHVQIKVPTQVKILNSNLNLVVSTFIGYSPIFTNLQTSILSQATQTIKVSNMVPNSNYYIDSDNLIKFSSLEFINPESTGTTDDFEITFYDQDYAIMTGKSKLTQGITTGILKNVLITPDNYRTREQVVYTISFTPTNDITLNGGVQIILPSDFSVNKDNLKYKPLTSNMLSNGIILYDSSTMKISITQVFAAKQTATLVSFQILSGIINPATTKPTGKIQINMIDSTGAVIDSDSSISLTPTVNEIKAVKVKPCSNNLTPSTTNDQCTYQLQIDMGGISYPILADSTIEITIPIELGINQRDLTSSQSTSQGIQDSKSAFSFLTSSSTERTLVLKNGFSSTLQTEFQLTSIFYLNLVTLTSPITTQPTSSFSLKIYDKSSFLQYKKDTGIYAQVKQSQNFTKASLSRSNDYNGQQNVTYNFSITLSAQCNKNDYIKVVPPSSIEIMSVRNQCRGLKNLQSSLSCTVKDKSLYILIQPISNDVQYKTYDAGETLEFQVIGIVNSLSLEPSESFQMYISNSQFNDYFSNQQVAGLTVTNKQSGILQNIQIIPDSNQLNLVTSYSFYMTTANKVPLKGYIEIYFPYQMFGQLSQAVSNIQCKSLKNLDSSTLTCKIDPRKRNTLMILNSINTTELSAGTELGVKVQNIKNPSFSTNSLNSEQFSIRTLSTTGYVIDQTPSQLNFTFGCTQPCNSCSDEVNKCTSCTIENPLSPLFLFDYQCIKNCPVGYYNDNVLKCSKCSYPCKNCFENNQFCSNCQPQSGLPFVKEDEGKCYQTCPIGTYISQSTATCENCLKPCKQCLSPSICLKCEIGFYFYEQKCFSQCPNTSVPIQAQEECQKCKEPCLTCNGNRENCTSCQISPNLFYLYENQCLEQCPKQYLPNDKNMCVKMSEPIYPFLTFIMTGTCLLVVILSNKIFPRTRFFTSFLCLESLLVLPVWVYLLVFQIKDQHKSSAGIVIVALIANLILNVFWYFYYKKKIVLLDSSYQLYMKTYPKTQRFCVVLSIITTFQFFRIQYSRLFNIKSLSCTFQLKEKYYQKLNRYSLLQITFVYMPVVASNIYNLIWTWYGRQVFWIDIESIFTSFLLLICHVVVILRSEYIYTLDKSYNVQNQTSINTTHRDNQTLETKLDYQGRDDKELDREGKQRQKVLEKIIGKIKGSKEALEILGHQTMSFDDKTIDISQNNDSDYMGIKHEDRVKYGITKPYQSHNNQEKNQNSAYKRLTQDSYRLTGSRDINDISDIKNSINGRDNQQQNDEFGITNRYQKLGDDTTKEDLLTTTQVLNDLDFGSAPITANKTLYKNQQLNDRYENFQKELEDKYGLDKSKIKPKNLNQDYTTLGMPNQTQVKNSQYRVQSPGRGKSHIYVNDNHNNQGENQDREIEEIYEFNNDILNKIMGKSGSMSGRERKGSQYSNSKYIDPQTLEEVKERIETMKRQRGNLYDKALGKNKGNQKYNQLIDQERSKQKILQDVVESLKGQLQEIGQLFEEARRRKQEQLKFIEQAHFTSDEEEMAVSPSNFDFMNQRYHDNDDQDENSFRIGAQRINNGSQSNDLTGDNYSQLTNGVGNNNNQGEYSEFHEQRTRFNQNQKQQNQFDQILDSRSHQRKMSRVIPISSEMEDNLKNMNDETSMNKNDLRALEMNKINKKRRQTSFNRVGGLGGQILSTGDGIDNEEFPFEYQIDIRGNQMMPGQNQDPEQFEYGSEDEDEGDNGGQNNNENIRQGTDGRFIENSQDIGGGMRVKKGNKSKKKKGKGKSKKNSKPDWKNGIQDNNMQSNNQMRRIGTSLERSAAKKIKRNNQNTNDPYDEKVLDLLSDEERIQALEHSSIENGAQSNKNKKDPKIKDPKMNSLTKVNQKKTSKSRSGKRKQSQREAWLQIEKMTLEEQSRMLMDSLQAKQKKKDKNAKNATSAKRSKERYNKDTNSLQRNLRNESQEGEKENRVNPKIQDNNDQKLDQENEQDSDNHDEVAQSIRKNRFSRKNEHSSNYNNEEQNVNSQGKRNSLMKSIDKAKNRNQVKGEKMKDQDDKDFESEEYGDEDDNSINSQNKNRIEGQNDKQREKEANNDLNADLSKAKTQKRRSNSSRQKKNSKSPNDRRKSRSHQWQLEGESDVENQAKKILDSIKNEIATGEAHKKTLRQYLKDFDQKEKQKIDQSYEDSVKEIKKKKKKKKEGFKLKKREFIKDDINRYGPYFNYLPFEKAVIESKGKTPYNNLQVEIIANKGYDHDNLGYWSPSTLMKLGRKNTVVNDMMSQKSKIRSELQSQVSGLRENKLMSRGQTLINPSEDLTTVKKTQQL